MSVRVRLESLTYGRLPTTIAMNSGLETIRPYQEADESDVIGVWYRSGRATYHFLSEWQTRTVEQAGEFFRKTICPGSDITVGVYGDEVVAYLAMRGSYIDRMYVDPREWRKGWGTRLIDFAKNRFPDGLVLHTHQENHAACSFYEKHGFEAVKYGVSPPPESAPDVEFHWQVKPIGDSR